MHAARDRDADVERRSVEELLRMVVAREEGRTEVALLLDEVGGLERLARVDAFELARIFERETKTRTRRAAIRAARAIAAAFELGRRVEAARAETLTVISSPADVVTWAEPRLASLPHEELWVIGLDGRGHVRGARAVARGGLHGAAVRPSDPVRAALRLDAAGFVLVHNHPSGDPTPSREDVVLTERVALAGASVGLPLLDHVVVARAGFACIPFPGIADLERGEAREGAKAPLVA